MTVSIDTLARRLSEIYAAYGASAGTEADRQTMEDALNFLFDDAGLLLPSELAQQIQDHVDITESWVIQYRAWQAGTPTGGPNGDGTYPIVDRNGAQYLLKSPAAIMAQLTGIIAKGTAPNRAALDGFTAQPGDIYTVNDTGRAYVRSASGWTDLGQWRGAAGKSAYELWKALAGNSTKTETEFWDWLKNAQIAAVQAAVQPLVDTATGAAETATDAAQIATDKAAVAVGAAGTATTKAGEAQGFRDQTEQLRDETSALRDQAVSGSGAKLGETNVFTAHQRIEAPTYAPLRVARSNEGSHVAMTYEVGETLRYLGINATTGDLYFGANADLAALGSLVWTSGNFDPASKAGLGANLFVGTQEVRASASAGAVALASGSTSGPGRVDFIAPDGVRWGYIGSRVSAQGKAYIDVGHGGDAEGFYFRARPLFVGATPWDSANFDPATKAGLAANTFTAVQTVKSAVDQGYSALHPGNATRSGLIAFHGPDGVRHGYIGYSDANYTYIQQENARRWRFSHRPLFGLAEPYDTDNFVGFVYKGTLGTVDLNTVTASGVYHQNANANATSAPNYPVGQAGMLEVLESGSFLYQRYTSYQVGNEVYTRSRYAGTWSAWEKQWSGKNLAADPTALARVVANGTYLRHQTVHGYIDFGPANTSYAHIYTDRPSFYFNAPILVNGKEVAVSGADVNFRHITATSGNIQTTGGGFVAAAPSGGVAFRHKDGAGAAGIATLLYKDTGNFYFLLTDSNAADGSYNGLRPLRIGLSDGYVYMANGLGIAGGFTTDGLLSSGDAALSSGNGKGLRFWNDDRYKVYMSASTDATWGGRMSGDNSDYNMYFRMAAGTNRGFVFLNDRTPVAGIDANGTLRLNGVIALVGAGTAGGVGVGYGVSAGWYHDPSNVAIRTPTTGGSIYFQNLSGAVTMGRWDTGGLNVATNTFINAEFEVNGGWVRVHGQKGLYFQSYGGGWYMTDTSWVRSYQNKHVVTGGDMQANDFIVTSDERLKKNIRPLEGSRDLIQQADPKAYEKNGREMVGLIAQDVQKFAPQMVREGGEYLPDGKTPALTLDLMQFIPHLLAEVKALRQEIETLKAGRA